MLCSHPIRRSSVERRNLLEMTPKILCVGRAFLAVRFQLSLALVTTLVTASECGAGAAVATARTVGTKTFQAPTPRVWTAVTVDMPIYQIGQAINIMFAATNLSDMPIQLTELRDDTVLVINVKEWPDSRFNFSNGPRPIARFLPPGKSTLFAYQFTELFKAPGVYRIVWRGKDFETLPVEFRVAENPF
jgi:hypothetical protein